MRYLLVLALVSASFAQQQMPTAPQAPTPGPILGPSAAGGTIYQGPLINSTRITYWFSPSQALIEVRNGIGVSSFEGKPYTEISFTDAPWGLFEDYQLVAKGKIQKAERVGRKHWREFRLMDAEAIRNR